MREAFRNLIKWEEACGHEPSHGPPTIPDVKTQNLRMLLIDEEHEELIRAILRDDLAGVADACADLCYVVIGTALAYGIDLPAVWDEVHASNLRKFSLGHRRDPVSGKTVKPPDWVPPDVEGILDSQRPLAETYGKLTEAV